MVRNMLWITATLIGLVFALLYYTSSNQGLPTHMKPPKPAAFSTHSSAPSRSVDQPGRAGLTA
jgi:hypothetical protein